MPITNKPIPRTQSQVINDTIKPYPPLGYGNPNISDNRGNDVSVKDDTDLPVNIQLKDIAQAIKFYIQENIKPSIVENGQQVVVPVEFAFGDRWNEVQKNGFLRDKGGRILLPMILLKRESVVKNRNIGNKLDGNNVHLYQSFTTKYTKKNQYDNFSVLTNRIPVEEYHISPVPDYVTITFNGSILTNGIEQCDNIIQAFNFAEGSYWGRVDKYRFSVMIDSFTDIVEYSQGEDRSVRSNFNMVVNAYLLPDSVNREAASQKKRLSKASLKFTMETTSSDLEAINFSKVNNPNKIPVTIIDAFNNNGGTSQSSLSIDIARYLDTDVELDATTVTTSSATFPAGFLEAPAGLPPTSLSNFIFFANGQYIPVSAIVSFVDNGDNTSTLTIDPSLLGYSFDVDWEIVARGKFGSSTTPDNAFVDSNGDIFIDSDGGIFLTN